MSPKRLGYALAAFIGALLGGLVGFAGSMWGGIEVFVPVCTILGAVFGLALAYIVELIILAIY
jgi:hypothetical protein